MIIETPSIIPKLPVDPPDSLPLHEFLFGDVGETLGRYPRSKSRPIFTCGITGLSYSVEQVTQRFEALARALAADLEWDVNGTHDEADRVAAFYAVNTMDTLTASWATQRISGIAYPISPTYTTQQVADQLKFVQAKVLFTSCPLHAAALEAASLAGIPRSRIYLLSVPEKLTSGVDVPADLNTVEQAISRGLSLSPLPPLQWSSGEGARRTAFLCSTSGTSGFPKLAKLTHHNVIAHVMQFVTMESTAHELPLEATLCALPLSHAFALIAVAQMSLFLGHEVVMLPKIDMADILGAIQRFHINRLWLIPPIIAAMVHAPTYVKNFDLSSVTSVIVGSASLSRDTLVKFDALIPGCLMRQGYGMTEATCALSFTYSKDVMFGSCGYLLPGTQGRIVDSDGKDIESHNQPGELLVRGPTIVPGYFNDEKAMKDALTDDGWLRTGDLVELRKSEQGYSHLFIVDRIKELIKVHGMQVAPAELEASLIQHPGVAEVSVVPIPDEFAGELPCAYIVKSAEGKNVSDADLRRALDAYVAENFPSHKRLAGGIIFVEALPRTISGKVIRSEVKKMAKEMASKEKAAKSTTSNVQVYTFDSEDED